MPITRSGPRPTRPSTSFMLLCALLCLLCLAGGASREDVFGQVVVRSAAWLALVAAALVGPAPPVRRAPAAAWLLAAAVGLALLQLIPLPPAVWEALPGRATFIAAAAGQPQPWRPLAIVPGAAVNALGSLVVPAATLVLMLGLTTADQRRVPAVLIALITASVVVALLQISGSGIDNPFVNDDTWQVSGLFANRNHFALFVALGLVLLPAWAAGDERGRSWRGPAALGLAPLFLLTILATGSRAGLLVGAMALGIALLLSWRRLAGALRHRARWRRWTLGSALAALIVGTIGVSVLSGRAASIDRLFAIDGETDIRNRARPVVLAMIRDYFPAGGGLGGFDPLFRLHEPFALLKLTYFNHAHNDYLELVLDAGLPGLLLLLVAVGWWMIAGVGAWRRYDPAAPTFAPVGASIILLILVASAFDYPARTPMVMALVMVAAVWLSARPSGSAALPPRDATI